MFRPVPPVLEQETITTTRRAATIRLRLYIRQRTFEAKAAIRQLHSLLEAMDGSYELQVLNVEDHQNLAAEDQIPVTPLLLRLSPLPVRWIPMPQMTNHELREELFS